MARVQESLARLRRPIATVELTPRKDTIRLKPREIVLGRSLVRRVLNGRGKEVKDYEVSVTVESPSSSAPVFGDTLPLQRGFNTMTVWVSSYGVDVRAKRKADLYRPVKRDAGAGGFVSSSPGGEARVQSAR